MPTRQRKAAQKEERILAGDMTRLQGVGVVSKQGREIALSRRGNERFDGGGKSHHVCYEGVETEVNCIFNLLKTRTLQLVVFETRGGSRPEGEKDSNA